MFLAFCSLTFNTSVSKSIFIHLHIESSIAWSKKSKISFFSGTECGDASCQYNYPALMRQDTGGSQGGTGSRRAHTTLRSNSVKEASQTAGDGTVLLKSALKKQNPNSTEVLSGEGGGGNPRSVVYSDQSFTDTYPRQAKSIPNINFQGSQGRDDV